MSIEVFDASLASGFGAASLWAENHGDALVETAMTYGAVDWAWHHTSWGVVFEVAFEDEAAWDAYRASLTMRTALDAVPDPVSGVLVYRGRGGSAGTTSPRRPRPLAGSGAAALPLPVDDEFFHAFEGDVERRRLTLIR
jgi:hypothetical protein